MAKQIEIFRTGRHTAMAGQTLSFGEAELAAMVAAYDPQVHEAPIVVGHPKEDAPAYGWVGALSVAGGVLQAEPRQVDPAFAEMVNAGRFKRVSASFYTPDSPSNPRPGAYYLRHVGFLGAQPPAVKGLKAASFAEAAGIVEFSDGYTTGTVARLMRGLREWLIGTQGQEAADKALPAWDIDQLVAQAAVEQQREAMPDPAPAFTEQPTKSEVPDVATQNAGGQPSAREVELEAEARRLRDQVAQFAEREAVGRRAEDAAFCERLVADGRLLPAVQSLAIGLLAKLDGADAVSFAEGRDAETPRDALRALLSAQPKAVEFGELAGGDGPRKGGPEDPHAIAAEAVAFQEAEANAGRHVSTAQAVAHVRAQSGAAGA